MLVSSVYSSCFSSIVLRPFLERHHLGYPSVRISILGADLGNQWGWGVGGGFFIFHTHSLVGVDVSFGRYDLLFVLHLCFFVNIAGSLTDR